MTNELALRNTDVLYNSFDRTVPQNAANTEGGVMTLKEGTQIAYVPTHCNGDINHPDVEFGFVTSVRDDVAFCRYWSKHSEGKLRTKANSEATPLDMLIEHVSVPQSKVVRTLEEIELLKDWYRAQKLAW